MNWKDETTVQAGDETRSHLTKITGVLEYLQWATDSNTTADGKLEEDDLVLMLDAYDIWMQLPPSVLIKRYFAANAQADQRLAMESGSAFDNSFPRQTILTSSQKRCFAPRNSLSDLHCRDLPTSPLPDNIFGFFTDSIFAKYQYARPRYLNSGSFMGPAGDMRAYFQRVSDRMNKHLERNPSPDELSGDQGIFAEIFGEQEISRREAMISGDAADALRLRQEDGENSEFHLGLDYTQELFYPTCYSETSGSFVRLSDSESLIRDSARAGVAPPRIESLPGDVALAPSPLAMLENSPVLKQSWASVPLYADFWTTSIPVGIHHNAWRDGLKDRQQTWWDRTWYFPFLREMLDLRMSANASSVEPIARIGAVETNHTLTVWPYQTKGSPRAALLFGSSQDGSLRLKGADWATVCQSRETADNQDEEQSWYDEVFRDGKGTFQ